MKRLYLVFAALALFTIMAACAEQRPVAAAPQIVSFSATPETLAVAEGETILRWEIQGSATELSLSPHVGAVSGSSIRVAPARTTTYTLTASNALGSHSARVTVSVPEPEPEAPPPGSSGANHELMGAWAFSIVGEGGGTLEGVVDIDADFMYEGLPGVWGFVSDCKGSGSLCARASLGGFIHEPETDRYLFGLGQADMSLTFMGEDADGKLSQSGEGTPLLVGEGILGADERAEFSVQKLTE